MMRYKSSKQTTRAHQQQLSYHAPAPLAAAAEDALTALCATLDSENESCSSSGNDDSSARDSIRLRVHSRIMQRVQELHDAYNGHEDHCQPPAVHQTDKQRAHPSNNNRTQALVVEPGTEDLELLRQDVISVAAQILERCLHHKAHHHLQHLQHLQQKRALESESAPSSSSCSASSSFELRLVHRMLAKESELLALQARRLHLGHNVRTATTPRLSSEAKQAQPLRPSHPRKSHRSPLSPGRPTDVQCHSSTSAQRKEQLSASFFISGIQNVYSESPATQMNYVALRHAMARAVGE